MIALVRLIVAITAAYALARLATLPLEQLAAAVERIRP